MKNCKTCGQKIQRFPDGGAVSADPEKSDSSADAAPPTSAMDDDSPEQTDDGSTPQTIQAEPYGNPQKGRPDEEDDDDEEEPAPAAAAKPSALPPKPANIPSAGTVEVQGVRPPPRAPPPTAPELDNEDALYAQDLQRGAIKPETYQSLFAKKDTLGKIGTLFGLLISGAGSGLAHQSNAVLDMMNKQIDNDLAAQKMSKDNTMNFMRISHEHWMQQAQMREMEFRNNLNQAQTSAAYMQAAKAPAEIAEAESRNALNIAMAGKAPAEKAEIAARTAQANSVAVENNTKSKMLTTAVQSLTNDVEKLPPGPAKDAGTNALNNVVVPGAKAQISKNNQQTAATLAAAHQADAAAEEAAFQKQQAALRMGGLDANANSNEARHYPGLGMASVPLTADDRDKIKKGMDFQNMVGRFMDWTKNHSGKLNPADRKTGEAMAADLQGAYRMATEGGVYKAGEQDFISKIIDSEPTKFFNQIRVMPQLNVVKADSAAQLDSMLKSKGFKGYDGAQPSQVAGAGGGAGTSKYAEGATGKDKNGNPVIFKGGKWTHTSKVGVK